MPLQQFKDDFAKLAFHLYLRDFQRVPDGLGRAELAIQNFAKDLGLSAEGIAVKLHLDPSLGKLEPGEQA